MNEKKWHFVGWLKAAWRERRPVFLTAVVLAVGLPVAIILGLVARDKTTPIVDKTLEQAFVETSEGEYVDAYNTLKSVENQAVTKSQKLALYSELAAAAANVDKIQEAVDYLKLKHELDPSNAPADAQMMAQLYERLGQQQDALAQYKLALEYYQSLPDSDDNKATVTGLKAVIEALESGDE